MIGRDYLKMNTEHSSTASSTLDIEQQNYSDMTIQQRLNKILLEAGVLLEEERLEAAFKKFTLLMEKIKFMKQNGKKYDTKLQMIALYNLATVFQKLWNLDECLPVLQRFIVLIKLQLNAVNCEDPHKNWFKMQTLLVQSLLQFCAVCSQTNNHEKAFKAAIEATHQLRLLFRRGLEDCKRFLRKHQIKPQSQYINESLDKEINQASPLKFAGKHKTRTKKFGKANAKDKVEFGSLMLLNARRSLETLSKMYTYEEMMFNELEKIQKEMKDIKQKTWFWKNNPENSVKMLRRQYNPSPIPPLTMDYTQNRQNFKPKRCEEDRNILGIKKEKSWIQEFTISKITYMTPLNYLEFIEKDNIIFEFNQKNLIEKVMFLAVTYFSIAIELRFIESEDGNIPAKDDILCDMKRSQIFHLKSMQIVLEHIKQDSAIVSHLISNYHKHYKSNLNIIQQENSFAQLSHIDPRTSSYAPSEGVMILESVPKEAEQIVQLPYEDIEPEYPKFAFRRPKIKCIDPDEQSNNVKTKDNDQTKKIKKNQSKKQKSEEITLEKAHHSSSKSKINMLKSIDKKSESIKTKDNDCLLANARSFQLLNAKQKDKTPKTSKRNNRGLDLLKKRLNPTQRKSKKSEYDCDNSDIPHYKSKKSQSLMKFNKL